MTNRLVARRRSSRVTPITRRRRPGHWLGGRPFGYRHVNGRLEADPGEAPIVRRIFAEVTAGKPLRAIADGLTADGVRPMRADRWSWQAVGLMIRNRHYAGSNDGAPALIDHATFEQAVTALRDRRGVLPRPRPSTVDAS